MQQGCGVRAGVYFLIFDGVGVEAGVDNFQTPGVGTGLFFLQATDAAKVISFDFIYVSTFRIYIYILYTICYYIMIMY